MAEIRLPCVYVPLPPQQAFRRSGAFVRGYGGAMGGGKSRALCEEALDLALDHPGIPILIVRFRHNSITETTKTTMLEHVLPWELVAKQKESGGEDYVLLHNGSVIHFIGLDDPVKWFSSEIGALFFDEAHEIPEESVTKLVTRLRHPQAPISTWKGEPRPGKVCLAFNPDNPGHWLYQWFIAGSDKTEFGSYKPDLCATQSDQPIGDAEFFFARAVDNIHLPAGYIRSLQGQPDHLRRRYLEGLWEYLGGSCYFDLDALEEYADRLAQPLYRMDFEARGYGERAAMVRGPHGKTKVFEEPDPDCDYAIGVDVATGHGKDFSAAYVTRLDEPRLVAEFHGKIDADRYAEQLHFLGRWYGTALIAVETAGGFGEPVIILLRDGKGPRPPYPQLYRHVLSSRSDLPVVKPYGYPVNTKTRSLILSQIRLFLRDRALELLPQRLYDECLTFTEHETGTSPRAMSSCNDDCVMAAAITLEMYRQKGHHPKREKRLAHRVKREKVTLYPWQYA